METKDLGEELMVHLHDEIFKLMERAEGTLHPFFIGMVISQALETWLNVQKCDKGLIRKHQLALQDCHNYIAKSYDEVHRKH